MKPLTRRELLAGTLATTATVAVGKSVAARRGVILGSLRGLVKGSTQKVFSLELIDLDLERRGSIELRFFAHGLAFDPTDGHRALLFEKKGPGACEVHLAHGQVVRPMATTKERAFYGHGAFSADGQVVFVTESVLATHQGLVSIRDGRTLAPLGEFPTYGTNPHDCQLIDGGRTLVVTNGGGAFPDGDAPSVTLIDVKSQKLLERLTFDEPRINAGHVIVSKQRALAVVSAPREKLPAMDPGAISLRAPGKKLVTMREPREVTGAMRGETLSLSLHEPSGIVAATNPDGNQLSFWDLGQQRLRTSVTLERARGVTQTLDGAHFVVSHGLAVAGLTFFSTYDLAEAPALAVDDTGLAGSHLYTWAGPRG